MIARPDSIREVENLSYHIFLDVEPFGADTIFGKLGTGHDDKPLEKIHCQLTDRTNLDVLAADASRILPVVKLIGFS